MPGVVQHSRDSLRKAAVEAAAGRGRRAHAVRRPVEQGRRRVRARPTRTGILNVAIRDVVAEVGDATVVMSDLCLDEFTDHGHCGVLAADGSVDNDATLRALRRDGARAGRGRGARPRPVRDDGRPGRRRPRARWTPPATPTPRSSPTPRSTPRRSTARSARPSSRRCRATGAPTSRTRPTSTRRCARSRSTSPRAPTSSWSSRRCPTSTCCAASPTRPRRHGVPVAAYQVSGEYAMVEAAAAQRLARPRAHDPRDADLDPPGRRRHRPHLLGRRGRAAAPAARRPSRDPTYHVRGARPRPRCSRRAVRRDAGRRELAGARLPRGRRHAAVHGRPATVPYLTTPTAASTSTWSARGGR